MTNIDDPTQTPPGYWFGVIDARLHQRMREALGELGLRRGGWRVLRALADGPATAEEIADRLPARRDDAPRRGHGGPGPFAGTHGHGAHYGWRGQEPRDEPEPADQQRREHEHEHDLGGDHGHHPHPHEDGHGRDDHHDHHDHHGDEGSEHGHHDHHHRDDLHGHRFEKAFERGYVRGFDRGFVIGATRAGRPFGHVGPFGHAPAPGAYGHDPIPRAHGHGAWGPGRCDPRIHGGDHQPGDQDARRSRRRAHRIHRILAEFVERGWVWFDGDRATLTDEGRAAHDRASEGVQSVRTQLSDGIAEADYATTLATLERMARNLGWEPAPEPEAPAGDAPSMEA